MGAINGRPHADEQVRAPDAPVEGEDYYWEGEAVVFTARYLLRRGYCCENGCRHCPYKKQANAPDHLAECQKPDRAALAGE